MKTESEELSNNPPTERGWYWVETNPAWKNEPELVFIGYPEYDDQLHVYTIEGGAILSLGDYCRKLPRRWGNRVSPP